MAPSNLLSPNAIALKGNLSETAVTFSLSSSGLKTLKKMVLLNVNRKHFFNLRSCDYRKLQQLMYLYIKVHTATRWTIRHLKLKKLQFIDPNELYELYEL